MHCGITPKCFSVHHYILSEASFELHLIISYSLYSSALKLIIIMELLNRIYGNEIIGL